jgi:UDPglucose 6-dehydrogenase
MKIAVFGTGYVGLVSAVCFAEMGHEVIAVDIDENKIDRLQKGEAIIYEAGLEEILQRNLKNKNIKFLTDAKYAIEFADVIFIAVGTPQAEDGSADLQYVFAVADLVGKFANGVKNLITKSTVPVETFKDIAEILEKHNKRQQVKLASNPEFLREGRAIEDFLKPDRVVVGIEDVKQEETFKEIYKPLKLGKNLLFMDIASAELTKYAANAMLVTRISFINEIANFAEKAGADINKISKAIGMDHRIGEKFLNAGLGYGGSCFPKDLKALNKMASKYGYDAELIEVVQRINFKQRKYFVAKVKDYFDSLENKKIAIWGLSFKPDTDDMRDAVSIYIIEELLALGAKLSLYDPKAMLQAKNIFANADQIKFGKDKYDAVTDSDALLLVTEWSEFRNADFVKVQQLMQGNVIFDGRNSLDADFVKGLAFDYFAMGC